MFVDREYRVGLGVSFYDRVGGFRRFGELLGSARTIVVYGPRNAGKSELVRYYSSRRRGSGVFLFVDVRRRAAEGVGVERRGVLGELAGAAAGLVEGVLGARGLVGLAEAAVRAVRGLGAGLLVVVIDEFHLLYHGFPEAVAELERVAGYLAKAGEAGARLVLTSSEGFVALSDVRRRLIGYSVGYMLVEGLDHGHMEALYAEYRGRRGCGVGFPLYWGVFGGAPGFLVEACPRGREELLGEYVPWLLRDTLDSAVAAAAAELSMPPRAVLRRVAELLGDPRSGGPDVLGDPVLLRLARRLVEYNVIYPCRAGARERYLPQLPVYGAAARLAAERGLGAASELPPRVLGEALERNEWSWARCG